MHRFDAIPELAWDWCKSGKQVALATVVQTWGSAPRRVGAQLVIDSDGHFEGSVSGGCVEAAVVLEAQEALEDGQMRLLDYGVSDDDAFAVGLACGGTIRILVEPIGASLSADMLRDLVQARANRQSVAYVVNTTSGARRLQTDGFEDRFRLDRSGVEEDGETFVAVHNPPLRLVIVGAVHIAQALVDMAKITGLDPIVVDPRDSFASPDRFPNTTLMTDWPDEALSQIGMDARTALVLLSHDPKLDDPALIPALTSQCFYIGALGSKKTQAARRDRMRAAGLTEDQISKIHGPVGLDIGASGPAEIALSILAELTSVLRGK